MLDDPRIVAMVREVAVWPWPPCVSHKSAGHPIHKLAFLADLGLDLRGTDAGTFLDMAIDDMDEGLPRITINIPERYGGSESATSGWALCDAPLMLYSLSRSFPGTSLGAGMNRLREMSRENGIPCRVSPELGTFRGPGKKDDPCRITSLYTLKAARMIFPDAYEGLARTMTDALLGLWKSGRERHPYMFFMGTDFRKLKLPFVWYDILSVADALSLCPWTFDDPRFREMISVIDSKGDSQGRFAPESIWTAWKGWDFVQKKGPSRWITFVIARIHRRMGERSSL